MRQATARHLGVRPTPREVRPRLVAVPTLRDPPPNLPPDRIVKRHLERGEIVDAMRFLHGLDCLGQLKEAGTMFERETIKQLFERAIKLKSSDRNLTKQVRHQYLGVTAKVLAKLTPALAWPSLRALGANAGYERIANKHFGPKPRSVRRRLLGVLKRRATGISVS